MELHWSPVGASGQSDAQSVSQRVFTHNITVYASKTMLEQVLSKGRQPQPSAALPSSHNWWWWLEGRGHHDQGR